jgi:hypothetical protein
MGKHGRKGPVEGLFVGLAFAVGFGILWWRKPDAWWAIFPIVFAGVIPFLTSTGKLIANLRSRPAPAQIEADQEKQALRIARDANGVVTPGVLALETDLTATQADEVLQRMTRKGYASMRVTDDGRIQYEFPEFMRRLES